ncbi:MAG TPA: hypothetical protein V6C81_19340 [Planktothrix sp.]|jgi:hypothetical protein
MTNQEKYLRAFRRGEVLRRVRGVYGRIVKTTKDQVDSLTTDPQRRVVMIMGPQGLSSIFGLSGYQALIKLGYTRKYIRYHVERGTRFKLVLFDRPAEIHMATWNSSIEMLAINYPEVASQLKQALPALKRTAFEKFQRQAGFRFLDVQVAGPSDPRYMTLERMATCGGSPLCVRRFLYHTVSFTDLFSGDGYTRTHTGNRGFCEYVMPNQQLSDLKNCLVGDIQVRLSRS